MTQDRKPALQDDNSFFEGEYKEYSKPQEPDSCATGTLTMSEIQTMYGIENTAMLRDYETASLRMSDETRSRRSRTDARIEELRGENPDEVTTNYVFDSDELTVGELIEINQEIEKQQKLLANEPQDPYVTSMLAAYPGEATEQIAVISVPSSAIAADESPFITVDEL